jgi:hypothetical protein
MPLHDWTARGGWEGMRHLWITELLKWIKPRLPEPYRVFCRLTGTNEDLVGGFWSLDASLFIEKANELAAIVDLVSPYQKDQPIPRRNYLDQCIRTLRESVNLLLVDIHPRPMDFLFVDRIANELQWMLPSISPPFAVTYGFDKRGPTGEIAIAIWHEQLSVGKSLPTMPLPLTAQLTVTVDLEETYKRAAADAYLP